MTAGSRPWRHWSPTPAKGARVLAGGSRIGNRGYYFPLTVLADVPDDARAMRRSRSGRLRWSAAVQSPG